MSRTKKGGKSPGYEFWGKRGWNSKDVTKGFERMQERQLIHNEVKNMEKDDDQLELFDFVNELNIMNAKTVNQLQEENTVLKYQLDCAMLDLEYYKRKIESLEK